MAAREHMPALDGLRGVAILLVLAQQPWIGGQLFFALSGFLITRVLLGAPIDFKGFFTNRALRVLPLYYLVLIVAFIIVPLDGAAPAGHGAHQFWLWTLTSDFALDRPEPAFPHLWFVAVEVQFYVIWPFVVRFLGRRGTAIAAALATAGAILVVPAIAGLGVGALVAALTDRVPLPRALGWKPLCTLGMVSYGMAIFHVPLRLFVAQPLVGDAPSAPVEVLATIALTAVTFACALLSYHFYERQFLGLKRS